MNQDTIKVQKMQDDIFKKMTVGQKIKIISQILKLARKLNASKNRKK